MNQAKFCEQCGAPLRPTTRFCGNCGAQVQLLPTSPVAPPPPAPPASSVPPAPPPAPTPAQQPIVAAHEPDAEPVIGVIPGLTRPKGLKSENFCLVVTPVRLVFALITQPMINAAVQQARADAKARGEGILGQVGAQMAYLDVLAERYQSIPVEQTLAEQSGNFFIPNAQIKKTKFKLIDQRRDVTGHYLVIETASGKYQFTTGGVHPNDIRELLYQALGAVVT